MAAELPARVAEELAWWARDVCGSDPALRLLPVASLHLTLAFLGSRPASEVDALGAALRGVVAPAGDAVPWPDDLAWDDLAWLPPRRPGALTVKLEDPGGRLAALQAAVVAAVAGAVDWTPEARPFLAHVTAARIRAGGRPRTLDLPLPSPERFGLEAVTLCSSQLGPDGAAYTPLARVVRP